MSDKGILSRISIASPCLERWEGMQGDEKKRFCARCKLHVFNLSAMSQDEASALLSSGPLPCVRFARRPDGTILTSECFVGRRKRWSLNAIRATCALFVLGLLGLRRASYAEESSKPTGGIPTLDRPLLQGKVRVRPVEEQEPPFLMGEIAVAPTPQPTPQPPAVPPETSQDRR